MDLDNCGCKIEYIDDQLTDRVHRRHNNTLQQLIELECNNLYACMAGLVNIVELLVQHACSICLPP